MYIFQLSILLLLKSLNNIGHNKITFPRNQNTFNIRNSSNLRGSRCRLETTKQKIEYIDGFEFNKLPNDLKSIQEISLSNTNLKKKNILRKISKCFWYKNLV